MRKAVFFLLFFIPGLRANDALQQATALLPNPQLTPGDANPALTKEVICAPEFRTGAYRHVTVGQKKRIAKAYGLDYEEIKTQVEFDHFISLEIGGSNDDKNIWPEFYEPRPGAHEKDEVENYLHKQVCNDELKLEDAQQAVHNWPEIYHAIHGTM